MREIKFRCWDKIQKVMREFEEVKNYSIAAMFDPVNDFEVMQYTGLKDKNGKEIYEGDIVKAQDGIWEVQWDDTQYVLMNDTKEEGSTQFIDNEYHLGETEIIGNIYENKELLK